MAFWLTANSLNICARLENNDPNNQRRDNCQFTPYFSGLMDGQKTGSLPPPVDRLSPHQLSQLYHYLLCLLVQVNFLLTLTIDSKHQPFFTYAYSYWIEFQREVSHRNELNGNESIVWILRIQSAVKLQFSIEFDIAYFSCNIYI